MNREKLNKHLTNNVILRIDYIPIPDEKVDEINNIIAEKYLNKIFSDSKQTFVRDIDIKMNDPSIQEFDEFIDIKEKNRIKSFEYLKINTNNEIEIKLIFNKLFCAIDINQKVKYYNYEYYSEIFVNILNILKKYNIIINRFGIKKFNDFFIRQDVNINDYVKDKYFNMDCSDLLKKSNSFISEKRYYFAKDNYNVNLTTHSSIGKLENEIVKRIAFDIDLYINDLNKLKSLLDNNNVKFIEDINDVFFDIFINVLNDKMKNMLSMESDIDDNIVIGVDYNEND